MFGRKKNNHNNIPNDLYEFLTEADRLYIRAFETRSIGLLKEHFTRDCCFSISRWIIAEAAERYFSDEKFRTTSWEILSDNQSEIIVKKTCVYKDIHITMSRQMKVSDDYIENWTILVTPDEYWVSDIATVTQ